MSKTHTAKYGPVTFGRVSFTYEELNLTKISDAFTYDIYSNCILSDGTKIPQISVGYNYENESERNHNPTITVTYENEDGSIYVH